MWPLYSRFYKYNPVRWDGHENLARDDNDDDEEDLPTVQAI